jgi:hypothetical protein
LLISHAPLDTCNYSETKYQRSTGGRQHDSKDQAKKRALMAFREQTDCPQDSLPAIPRVTAARDGTSRETKRFAFPRSLKHMAED